ncbi:MAG: hypothetical protein U0W24_02000 [Bacteroidales bacterium]
MKRLIFSLFIFVLVIPDLISQIKLESENLVLSISNNGQITEMINPAAGKNYLATGQDAPLLKIKTSKEWERPVTAVFDNTSKLISLIFENAKVTAKIRVTQNKGYLVFELVELSDKINVNAVCWGPYPLTINKVIAEVVGVVRDGEFAIGLQALNTKTLGGVLKNEEGADVTRGSVAIAQPYGSSLQAFSLNRSKARSIMVWGQNYPEMPVDPIAGETVIGSKIALFGCEDKVVLARIGEIELAEGLPHPLINGIWHKKSPETGQAYLISDFNENNIDEMLEYTRQAGLMSLYHEGPFKSWGHFILDPKKFPNGNAGMKKCVEKAKKLNIRIGVHTLSTFINTNDPYVSPIPDKRLAKTGSSVITAGVNESEKEIGIESDKYFKNIKPSTLHAVMIGDEIIRFREVSATSPYKLLDCQRGAFGSKVSEHKKGETISMLMDYPYKTLFPNFELQQEIAGNLARFFNETGVSQMDFDGHEGCQSSGEGDYGMQAFADKVFRDTDHTLVNGTSRSSHYYWHICHYWNWGEPWYGGFRESQGDYRLENQPFLERNYMPNMLGWFLLSSTTTAGDIEWMMARAAGYHAGFALVASYSNLKKNPETSKLIALINLWQQASKQKIFSQDQLDKLKNPENDFHLEKSGKEWKLYPFKKHRFEHVKQSLQPGQPTFSEWEFDNTETDQPLTFAITLVGKDGKISNPSIELDNYFRLDFPGDFNTGQSIVCDGKLIKIYSEKGSFIKEMPLNQNIPVITQGKHTMKFDCDFGESEVLKIRFVVKTIGRAEVISE